MFDTQIYLDLITTSDSDLAHTKVDPYQDPTHRPQPGSAIYSGGSLTLVGQSDSISDQARQSVGQADSMTPALYEAKESFRNNTDLHDSTIGEEIEPL